jgi:hypothetical protein
LIVQTVLDGHLVVDFADGELRSGGTFLLAQQAAYMGRNDATAVVAAIGADGQ